MSVNAMQEFWRRRQPPREWAGGSATKGQLTYGHTWSPSRWCILQSMQCRYVVIFMPWSDLLHDTSFLLFGRLTYFMCGPEWDVDCHWVSNRQCKCKASVLRGLKLVLSDWCLCLAVFRTAVPGVDLAETGLKGHLGCSILPTNQFAALLNCCIMDLRGKLASFRLTELSCGSCRAFNWAFFCSSWLWQSCTFGTTGGCWCHVLLQVFCCSIITPVRSAHPCSHCCLVLCIILFGEIQHTMM